MLRHHLSRASLFYVFNYIYQFFVTFIFHLRFQNELELLLMDDKEEKQHFNMKEIIENETKKKKRRKGKEGKAERIDEFEIDVQDTRFSALFNSPDYILDPSNPHFKYVLYFLLAFTNLHFETVQVVIVAR